MYLKRWWSDLDVSESQFFVGVWTQVASFKGYEPKMGTLSLR